MRHYVLFRKLFFHADTKIRPEFLGSEKTIWILKLLLSINILNEENLGRSQICLKLPLLIAANFKRNP